MLVLVNVMSMAKNGKTKLYTAGNFESGMCVWYQIIALPSIPNLFHFGSDMAPCAFSSDPFIPLTLVQGKQTICVSSPLSTFPENG